MKFFFLPKTVLSFQFLALLTAMSSFQQVPSSSTTAPPSPATFSNVLSGQRHHRWSRHPPCGQTPLFASRSSLSHALMHRRQPLLHCSPAALPIVRADTSSAIFGRSCHCQTRLIVLSPNLLLAHAIFWISIFAPIYKPWPLILPVPAPRMFQKFMLLLSLAMSMCLSPLTN